MFHKDHVFKSYEGSIFLLCGMLVLVWGGLGERLEQFWEKLGLVLGKRKQLQFGQVSCSIMSKQTNELSLSKK